MLTIFLSHVDPQNQRLFRKSRFSTPKVAQVRIVRQSDECGRGSLQAGCDLATDPIRRSRTVIRLSQQQTWEIYGFFLAIEISYNENYCGICLIHIHSI